MRVAVSWNDRGLDLRLRLEAGETLAGIGQTGMPLRLVTNEASVQHPALSSVTHPDLVALAVVTLVAPWARERLRLNVPVSRVFSAAAEEAFGLAVGPVDDTLEARSAGKHVGLLYSGGLDSLALLGLLPPDSPLVHLKRIRHPRVPNRATHLRVDVSEHFARRAETPQRELQVVSTDLEFLCQPFPTYPTWPAIAVGAVLLADQLNLGAIASGMILGGRYLLSGYHFNAIGFKPDGENDRAWRTIFEAVGLPHFRGVAGASEILTHELVARSGSLEMARSCQLGTREAPCWNCGKCLRRELVDAAFHAEPLPDRLLANISQNKALIAPFLRPPPYYQQHVLEYVLARTPGLEGTFLETTRDQLVPTVAGTEWVRRYYSPALDDLPDPWRQPFLLKLQESVDYMTDEERSIVEAWDPVARQVKPTERFPAMR